VWKNISTLKLGVSMKLHRELSDEYNKWFILAIELPGKTEVIFREDNEPTNRI